MLYWCVVLLPHWNTTLYKSNILQACCIHSYVYGPTLWCKIMTSSCYNKTPVPENHVDWHFFTFLLFMLSWIRLFLLTISLLLLLAWHHPRHVWPTKTVFLLSRLSTTLALVPETWRRCWPMHQGLCIFHRSELQAYLGWAWGSCSTSKNQLPYFVLKFVWISDRKQILWQPLNSWEFMV